jgi:hypothetical protein
VNFVSYVLSSYQKLEKPSIINHYLFIDPVYGTSIIWPTSADGYLFVDPDVGTNIVYTTTANGGLFFPWGYPINNTSLSAYLGEFKGDTTLTLIPSAIDNTLFPTLKIIYDFDDNRIIDVEKGIVQNLLPTVATLNPGTPNSTNISHIYRPPSRTTTTYYPSVTVLNGNLVLNIFNLSLDIFPDTLFKFDDFHLINSAQITKIDEAYDKSLEVFEITEDTSNYITNFLIVSSDSSLVVPKFSTPMLTPTPTVSLTPAFTPTVSVTPSITPTITPTLTITPTVSITPTITPTISLTPTYTPTTTPTVSLTPTITTTVTPSTTVTPTASITPTITLTPTQTPTNTPTVSITPTITLTRTPVATTTPTVTPTITLTPTISETPTQTPTITPTISITPSVTKTPTPTVTPSFNPFTRSIVGTGEGDGISTAATSSQTLYYNGNDPAPTIPVSMVIYINDSPVMNVVFNGARLGQSFGFSTTANGPLLYSGVFTDGSIYITI